MKTVTPEEFDEIRKYLPHKRSKREGTEGFCFWVNENGRIIVELWLNENGEHHQKAVRLSLLGDSIQENVKRSKRFLENSMRGI